MGETQRAVDALDGMRMTELRERYAEVFGEPTRSSNRRWLTRRIAWRLQAMAEGGLTDRARQRAAELARDEDLRVRPPGEIPAQERRDRAAVRTVSGRLRGRADERIPIPGTVLTRIFKGEEYRVTILAEGFEYGGKVYRSLSAVAHAISGSHWNGFHFFGLTRPKRKDSA